MKRLFNFFIVILFLFPNSYIKSQINIVVIDFSAKNISSAEASALTDRLRTELFLTTNFRVVERELVNEILNEQGFQETGCVTNECIVRIGRLIGVEQIVGGSISRVGKIYSVSARIIQVETGEIIKISTYDHDGEIGDLLRHGMKIVAIELAGFETEKQIAPTKSQLNQQYRNYTIGIESFALPYASGGYGLSIWVGNKKFKVRGALAELNSPSVYLTDGFEKDRFKLTYVNIEYLFMRNFNGFWVGSGISSWKGSVGHEDETERGAYEYIRYGINFGYVHNIFYNIYLNAWGGFYFLIIGDTETQVGNKTCYFPEGVPILSLDLGWHF